MGVWRVDSKESLNFTQKFVIGDLMFLKIQILSLCVHKTIR